jgi:hypothetical protein
MSDLSNGATSWVTPELVPQDTPIDASEYSNLDATQTVIDATGNVGTASGYNLGSGVDNGELLIDGSLTLQSSASVTWSSPSAVITGTGSLINDGQIGAVGADVFVDSYGGYTGYVPAVLTIGAYPNDTAGDTPTPALTLVNDGVVHVGENFYVNYDNNFIPDGNSDVVISAAIDNSSTGSFSIGAGTLEIASDTGSQDTYSFGVDGGYNFVGSGLLIIDNPGTAFNEVLTNFVPNQMFYDNANPFAPGPYGVNTGTIELRGIGPVGNAELDIATHTLDVYSDYGTADLIYQFTNVDAGADLSAEAVNGFVNMTGMIITGPPPCFAAGTMIALSNGELPVERLRPGDRVMVLGGPAMPVRWIGHREIDAAAHPSPASVWPIRIAPHAFADGAPARPLFLSPDHAVFLCGVLIPIRHLVNGTTIAQEPRDRISYWHVELDRHAILHAEGLAAESYLDTGNRGAFANAALVDLVPSRERDAAGAWGSQACAPLVESGPSVLTARGMLGARAAAMGVGGRDVVVEVAGAGEIGVTVSAGAEAIRIVSQAGRVGSDRRVLGSLLRAVLVDGAEIDLRDGRLGLGFHEVEVHGARRVRWTDGNAVVRLGPGRCERHVELSVAAVAAA